MSDLQNPESTPSERHDSMGAAEVFEQVLEMFRAGNPLLLLDLMAEDAVMEFPFAPPGRPRRLEGKNNIIEYLQAIQGNVAVTSFTDVEIHRLIDPNCVVVEMTGHGTVLATGAAYERRYVDVCHTKNGRIQLFRDYWNPQDSPAQIAKDKDTMSKVVIFNGSPRKNGYTAKLLEQVAKGAKSRGAEVSEFDLNDPGIRGCQGCFYCRTHDGCALQDYLQPMYKAITEADAIVFGSPIYAYQIAGQAKIWLDRTFPMVGDNFTPRHPGKKFISVFTQGSPNPEMGAEGIKVVNSIFARYGWRLEDSIHCCGTTDFHSEKFERFNSNLEIFEELSLRAFKDGENLVR